LNGRRRGAKPAELLPSRSRNRCCMPDPENGRGEVGIRLWAGWHVSRQHEASAGCARPELTKRDGRSSLDALAACRCATWPRAHGAYGQLKIRGRLAASGVAHAHHRTPCGASGKSVDPERSSGSESHRPRESSAETDSAAKGRPRADGGHRGALCRSVGPSANGRSSRADRYGRYPMSRCH
jgi:hypothetical protein